MFRRIRINSLAAKLALATFLAVGGGLAALTWWLAHDTSAILEGRALESLIRQSRLIVDELEVLRSDSDRELVRLTSALRVRYGEAATLDTTHAVKVADVSIPTLRLGKTPIVPNDAEIDRFGGATGAAVTIFVKSGDDFVRVATTLKKPDGSRAIGTPLDRKAPSYAALTGGAPYSGLAALFGGQYAIHYDPIKDAGGQVVGALFVGIDLAERLATIEARIREIKIGTTGYVYIIDANPGEARGRLVMHPAKKGQVILDAKDAGGRTFIREMVDTRSGVIRYPWSNPELGDARPRDKIVAYSHFPGWNWVVAAGSYVDEFSRDSVELMRKIAAVVAGAVLLLCAALYWIMRRMISRPLARAVEFATAVAAGNLTSRVESRSNDEIGTLMATLATMQRDLAQSVARIRTAAGEVDVAASEIASGNGNLASRTESQAASLQETASSMEELTATVRLNADNARQANQLALGAYDSARRGGEVVGEVVGKMQSITDSSQKVVDIISVIDGIAFQTNILALNAAVEAARAGEQGRGFAVVASEVRKLAQRSAAAAKEIKGLITDSTREVETGSRLVQQAGATIREMVGSVQRVADIVAEISAASAEQSAGIEQVNLAVTQMDDAVQQNAALVEQAAAAAMSLGQQGRALVDAVAVFTLDEQGAAADEVPPRSASVTALDSRRSPRGTTPTPSIRRRVANSDVVADDGIDDVVDHVEH